MSRIFPSKDAARAEICGEHWKDAHDVKNDPRIDYKLMMTRTFDCRASAAARRRSSRAARPRTGIATTARSGRT